MASALAIPFRPAQFGPGSCSIVRPSASGESMFRLLIVVVASLLGGCGYNQLQSLDEQVKGSWSEVINQYQRRADLIPNLVNTVKGFAQQEKDVLIGVTEA